MERIAVGIEEAGPAVGLSKYTIRAYLRAGPLLGTRCRRRWIIPVIELERLVCEGSPSKRDAGKGGPGPMNGTARSQERPPDNLEVRWQSP